MLSNTMEPEPTLSAAAAFLPRRDNLFVCTRCALQVLPATATFCGDARDYLLVLYNVKMCADNLAFTYKPVNFINPAQEYRLGLRRIWRALGKL